MKYKELLNSIKKEFPNKAIDISESLELLRIVIEDIIESIGLKIDHNFSQKQYNKIPYYSEIAEELSHYEKGIEELIDILDIDDSLVVDKKEYEAENNIINYERYLVDKNIEYSLYDNFTHKRPYAFKLLNANLVKVNTWKEMLLEICKILINIDEKKFINFEKIKHMNGRKKKYFAKESKGMRSPKKIGNKVYIETNLSANAIRNLLIKLLKEYEIKITDLKIYLRADYTEINKD